MILHYFVLGLLFIRCIHTQTTTTTVVPFTCSQASWLDWSSWTTCSDSCGSCGMRTRTRVCLSTLSTCSCQGDGLGVEYCNLSVCRYPRQSCCNSMKVTTVNGMFACQTTSTLSV
ncbi:hypothetical protein PRIPAC_90611 [Pristionchus pacificus]|nr:hypothetical protein PRIPAC_90611 [Pristionchus pacificus]